MQMYHVSVYRGHWDPFAPKILFIKKTSLCNILQFFYGFNNDNFQMKNCNIFHIFAQNIDCGYTLEPPQ